MLVYLSEHRGLEMWYYDASMALRYWSAFGEYDSPSHQDTLTKVRRFLFTGWILCDTADD